MSIFNSNMYRHVQNLCTEVYTDPGTDTNEYTVYIYIYISWMRQHVQWLSPSGSRHRTLAAKTILNSEIHDQPWRVRTDSQQCRDKCLSGVHFRLCSTGYLTSVWSACLCRWYAHVLPVTSAHSRNASIHPIDFWWELQRQARNMKH